MTTAKSGAQRQKAFRDRLTKPRDDDKVDFIMSYRHKNGSARIIGLLTYKQFSEFQKYLFEIDNPNQGEKKC